MVGGEVEIAASAGVVVLMALVVVFVVGEMLWSPNADALSYHRIGGSFEKGSPLFVTINSYPDKAARDSGACAWMEPVVIPWEEWKDIYDAIAPMLYELVKAHGFDGEEVEDAVAGPEEPAAE